jgi:hypothetical protein
MSVLDLYEHRVFLQRNFAAQQMVADRPLRPEPSTSDQSSRSSDKNGI